MILLLLTFGYAILSAIVPVLNMEAYLLVSGHVTGDPAWATALAASVGMNLGKMFWYAAARGAPRLPWVRRRLERPKLQAQVERWAPRVQGRPWTMGALNFVSAAVGVPPFFAMAIIGGVLRVNVPVFILTGVAGRFVFFLAILTGVRALFG